LQWIGLFPPLPGAFAFQFPFHRDRLCNLQEYEDAYFLAKSLFQFPFHRDRLCNILQHRLAADRTLPRFNSLFIGIGFAIITFDGASNLQDLSGFNSLFIGIGFAILWRGHVHQRGRAFQFPFHRDRLCNFCAEQTGHNETSRVSIPFSSG